MMDCEKIVFTHQDAFITFYVEKKTKFSKQENSLIIGTPFDKDFNIQSQLNVNKIECYYGEFIYFGFEGNQFRVFVNNNIENKAFFSYEPDRYVFASSMELLFTATKRTPTVNWPYMLSFIRLGNLATHYTSFLETYEIPFNCQLLIDAKTFSHTIHSLWHPRAGQVPSKEEWEELFLKRLDQAFSPLSDKKRLILELSGGLDSSLLCGIMSRFKDRFEISAINFYNENDPNSDERFYANRVASYFNIPIHYLCTNDTLSFSSTKFLQRPNKPSTTFFYLANEARIHELAQSIGEDYTLISGHGGDSLFFSALPMESIVDAYLCEGRRTALAKLDDLRSVYPNPYMHDLKACLKIYWKYLTKNKFSFHDQISPCMWLEDRDKTDFYDYQHPVFRQIKSLRMLPGKAMHLEILYITISSIERQMPIIYPYLSKQVIESGFDIPTYQSYTREFDRCWVREAFAKIAEPALAYRRSKGHTTSEFYKGVRENFKLIQEICMEGQFVQNLLVNKEILHENLLAMREGIIEKAVYISNLFCAELFLKEWDVKSCPVHL